jgi:Tfp pilus assembly protein PilF
VHKRVGWLTVVCWSAWCRQQELSSGQTSEIKAISLALHLNMALCHFKQNKLDRVIDDCNKALQLDPNSVKALFRRGQGIKKTVFPVRDARQHVD